MSHRKFKSLLEEYASGRLTPECSLQVEKHLELCQECLEELDTLRLTQNIVRAAVLDGCPVPAPRFAGSILQNVEEQKEFYFFWSPLRLAALRALPVMAALAIVLGAFAYFEISSLNARDLPAEPLLESSLELSSSKWGQESAVFSDSVSRDREQVVSTLMEGDSNALDLGKE